MINTQIEVRKKVKIIHLSKDFELFRWIYVDIQGVAVDNIVEGFTGDFNLSF